MKERFYSKKDIAIGVFLHFMILFLLFVGFGVPYLPHNKPIPAIPQIIVVVLTTGSAIMIGAIWYNTYYEIDNEMLTCRSGPFFKRLQISSIHSISSPRKLFLKQSYMSLGLSFTQVIISYNTYDDISISPTDFERFVSALKLRNPGIEVV
jgi:hypothetical protein